MPEAHVIGVTVTLTLDGKQFQADQVSYGVSRNTDERGSPTDAPKCSLIRLLVIPHADEEFNVLYDWAFRMDRTLSGTIEFTEGTGNSTVVRKVEFMDAYCVGFREAHTPSESTMRYDDQLSIPNSPRYEPRHRGRDYFQLNERGLHYQLVVSPARIRIGSIEVQN